MVFSSIGKEGYIVFSSIERRVACFFIHLQNQITQNFIHGEDDYRVTFKALHCGLCLVISVSVLLVTVNRLVV